MPDSHLLSKYSHPSHLHLPCSPIHGFYTVGPAQTEKLVVVALETQLFINFGTSLPEKLLDTIVSLLLILVLVHAILQTYQPRQNTPPLALEFIIFIQFSKITIQFKIHFVVIVGVLRTSENDPSFCDETMPFLL